MILPNVKTDVKQQEIKELVAASTCYKKYLQNFKYNVRQAYIFHLIFIDIYSIQFDIVC